MRIDPLLDSQQQQPIIFSNLPYIETPHSTEPMEWWL
jgi:hypothetical protein